VLFGEEKGPDEHTARLTMQKLKKKTDLDLADQRAAHVAGLILGGPAAGILNGHLLTPETKK
jgi:hypothetical protein